MNQLLSGAFGLNSPLLLAGGMAAVAALLYWAYLRRGRMTQVIVSTTMLLKKLAGHAHSRKKFVPPFRFFFELLMLFLLCLSLSGLYHTTKRETLAILVDNSLSMGRNDGLGQSLLELAKEKVAALLTESEDGALVKIYQSSPTLRALAEDAEGPGPAASSAYKIKISYAEDDLSQALSRLLHDPELFKIHVFSDKALQIPAQMSARVVSHLVRSETAQNGNLAITGIRREAQSILVEVANFGEKDAIATLKLIQLAGEGARFASFENSSHNLRLKPRAKSSGSFVLPQTGALFQISLEPDRASSPTSDSNAMDNQAYLSVLGGTTIVVNSDLTLAELGLTRIERFSFRAGSTTGSQIAAQILHRRALDGEPNLNSILIMPSSTPWSKGEVQFERAQITSWDKSSPILDYLNLSSLQLNSGNVLTPPAWAKVLIRSDKGVVAWVGERQGRRIICFGFELFPYQGANDATLSILTINALKYLTENSLDLTNVSPGELIHLLPHETGYAANQDDLLSSQNAQTFAATAPGVIRTLKDDATSRELAVNFFDEAESNPTSSPALSVPVVALGQAAMPKRESLVDLLSKLVLVLLALDLLLSMTLFQKRPIK